MRRQERISILLNAYEKWFSHSWFLFNFLADTYVPLLPFPLSQWDSFARSTKQKLWLKQRAIAKPKQSKEQTPGAFNTETFTNDIQANMHYFMSLICVHSL